jgi:SAM-dependent methyltransferase
MLKKAYDRIYYGENSEKFHVKGVEKLLDLFRSEKSYRLSKYLKEDAKILDIGCGNGRFLLYMLRYGKYQLYGTELEGSSAERTSRIPEISLKTGNLEMEDFPARSFDAITLFHVFEHLVNPRQVMEIISHIIKQNGILMVSLPNIESFQSRIFKGNWLHLDPPRHLVYFSPADFVMLLEIYGFKLLKTRYVSIVQNPYGFVQSLLNTLLKKREVLYERLKGNPNYAPEYGKFSILIQKIFFVLTMPFFIISDLVESLFHQGASVEFIFRREP